MIIDQLNNDTDLYNDKLREQRLTIYQFLHYWAHKGIGEYGSDYYLVLSLGDTDLDTTVEVQPELHRALRDCLATLQNVLRDVARCSGYVELDYFIVDNHNLLHKILRAH